MKKLSYLVILALFAISACTGGGGVIATCGDDFPVVEGGGQGDLLAEQYWVCVDDNDGSCVYKATAGDEIPGCEFDPDDMTACLTPVSAYFNWDYSPSETASSTNCVETTEEFFMTNIDL